VIRTEHYSCSPTLFKFFLDLNVDAEGFDHSTFSKNRKRLLKQEIADCFFAAVVKQAHLRRYISGEHFSVDGTLLEAWASHKSFRLKDDGGKGGPPTVGRNQEVDYHGERRSNETHQSTTDPEARLARKGNSVAAKLSYAGHLLMENRSALIADMELSQATGYAERETALRQLRRLPKSARRRTVGLMQPGPGTAVRNRRLVTQGNPPRLSGGCSGLLANAGGVLLSIAMALRARRKAPRPPDSN
jgi:hypothetical protein